MESTAFADQGKREEYGDECNEAADREENQRKVQYQRKVSSRSYKIDAFMISYFFDAVKSQTLFWWGFREA